jgi:hypothetical protein
MNAPAKTVGLTLAGAVALASGAYALGTQADDGSADAASDRRAKPAFAVGGMPPGPPGAEVHFRAGPGGPGFGYGFGLSGLADRLGVDEQKLKDALRDLRPAEPDEGRDDFAAALADELGIEQDKLKDALDNVHRKLRKQMEDRREEFLQKLADRLGVSVDKLKDAFPGPPRLERRHP